MTDFALDPFEQIRGELLRAARRDVSRGRHRARVLRVAVVTLGAIVLLTGIAAAASERVARAVHAVVGVDVLGVVESADPARRPSPEAAEWNSQLGMSQDPTLVDLDQTKVLMAEEVDGHYVEITAFPKKADPAAPDQRTSVCMSLAVDHSASSATCGATDLKDVPASVAGSELAAPKADYIESTIWGITSGSVTGVNVVTPDGVLEAHMGDHSFWVRTREQPLRLEFLLNDGTKASQDRYSSFWRCKSDPTVQRDEIEKCAFAPPKGGMPKFPLPVTYSQQ